MNWYEDDIRQLEARLKDRHQANHTPETKPTVFYGSSSIRLWTTLTQDYPDTNILNLGFGGSTLAACAWFFERIVVPTNPESILFYAGDNDLGDGRHPEEVFLFFCAFAEKVHRLLPGVPVTFMSIKISPSRWNIHDNIRITNRLIAEEIKKIPDFHYIDMTTVLLDTNRRPRRELFESDGLHLNPAGYRLWKQALQEQFSIA